MIQHDEAEEFAQPGFFYEVGSDVPQKPIGMLAIHERNKL
jgi:hypothetical protein